MGGAKRLRGQERRSAMAPDGECSLSPACRVGGRVHALRDFHVEVLDQAHQCVLALGGRSLESAQGWRVYADPAGHPFCLVGGLVHFLK